MVSQGVADLCIMQGGLLDVSRGSACPTSSLSWPYATGTLSMSLVNACYVQNPDLQAVHEPLQMLVKCV